MRRRLLDASISAVRGAQAFLSHFIFRMYPVVDRLEWIRFSQHQLEVGPDDVFIVTYPKSGTTWVQMMAWQLVSGGSLDFRHIDDVVPYIERCNEADLPRLSALPRPRFFKTHLPQRDLPRGARYVYVVRKLEDLAISYYHHTLLLENFAGGLDAFVKKLASGRTVGGSWAEHVLPWLDRRGDPSVLLLSYEEMKADPAGTLRRLARFSGVALDEARLPLLVEQSSAAFMKTLDARFDPRMARRVSTTFIRKGETGEGARTLDPSLLALLAGEKQRVLDRAHALDPSGVLSRWLSGEGPLA